jgi:hypothetical protein
MSIQRDFSNTCYPDSLPTMSPTVSEILDRQQAMMIHDRQTQEKRLQALELTVKELQE